jgi:hypothetical protein
MSQIQQFIGLASDREAGARERGVWLKHTMYDYFLQAAGRAALKKDQQIKLLG